MACTGEQPMSIVFSKPSCGVVTSRQEDFLQKNAIFIERCTVGTAKLLAAPARKKCPLCASATSDDLTFEHRGAPYLQCHNCEHVFSVHDASCVDYDVKQYANVYPALSSAECTARQKDIYEPKLDWVLEVMHNQLGLSPSETNSMHWLELGCGEGLFLKSLQDKGIQNFYGLDADVVMAERASLHVGKEHVQVVEGPLQLIQNNVTPNVVVAWFVFEHVFQLDVLAEKLKQLPKGTILCFSVPMFSMASLFDNIFEDLYPRTLDNMVHTQLFTDRSIAYFLELAKFNMVSQWVFGQDSSDLMRCMQLRLANNFSPSMLKKVMLNCNAMLDELQTVMDKAFFADSRHVVAIKQ